jgi:hypothetical protein
MEYGKIIAVTGLPGLFELLASKNDGAIVRSLEDKSTKFVSSRVHNFSHLESIEVFTVRDNVNLVDIFNAMENEVGKVPDGKDASALKKYFEKVYPDLDFERVYTSDLKKMAKWYEILKANNIEIKLTEQPEPEQEEQQPEPVPAAEIAEKEEPKAPVKKKAKAEPAADESSEEKPKKAAAKKKTEPAKEEPVAKKSAKEKVEKPEKEKAAKAPAKKSAPKKK